MTTIEDFHLSSKLPPSFYIHFLTVGESSQASTQQLSQLSYKKKKEIISSYTQIPQSNILLLKQEHTDIFHRISENDLCESNKDYYAVGDALITDSKNIALAIQTADCLPIFLSLGYQSEPIDSKSIENSSHRSKTIKSTENLSYNHLFTVPNIYDKKNIISLVHAGWRGLEKGIVYKTFYNMLCLAKKLDIALEGVFATGPNACEYHYEVGKEFIDKFRLYSNCIYKKDDPKDSIEHFFLNMRCIAKQQILTALKDFVQKNLNSHYTFLEISKNFLFLDFDSSCDDNQSYNFCTMNKHSGFFSHRRGILEKNYGRNLNIIYIRSI